MKWTVLRNELAYTLIATGFGAVSDPKRIKEVFDTEEEATKRYNELHEMDNSQDLVWKACPTIRPFHETD